MDRENASRLCQGEVVVKGRQCLTLRGLRVVGLPLYYYISEDEARYGYAR